MDAAPDAPPPCPAGQTRCAAACADLSADRAHCGACGRVCLADQTCFRGACVPGCPTNPAQGSCNWLCVSLLSDEDHCGACGVSCIGGTECVQGACRCPSTELTLCGSGAAARCEATQYDPRHCGACGVVCGAGLTLCGERCRNLSNDSRNCGRCGNACPNRCAAGSCAGG